jgi:hypothetical protein
MAKKSKRQVNRSSGRPVAPLVTGESTRSFDRDFSPDYTHVIPDLKRIGTLAASFLVVLIILSFILH